MHTATDSCTLSDLLLVYSQWGRNDCGQLGLGHYTHSSIPEHVTAFKKFQVCALFLSQEIAHLDFMAQSGPASYVPFSSSSEF